MELLSQARFVSIDASQKWLEISLQGRVQDGERSERLVLIVRVLLDGDHALIAPGDYRYGENGMPGLDAEVDYERREGERAFSRYQFEGLSLSLRIEQADEGHLVGRFSLDARQREGRRGLDGAVEEVQLANDGEVNVQAIFDITNVDVITP